MRFPPAAALLAACLVLPAVAWAQAPGQTISVGDWKVSNSKNKEGVQTCATFVEFDDKSIVGFSAGTDGTTTFLVSEPDAALKENGQYPVSYQVDKNKAWLGTGIAVDAHMIVVPVPNPDEVFQQFMAGNTLSVTAAGKSFDEPLDGSSNAITALASCIRAAKGNQ